MKLLLLLIVSFSVVFCIGKNLRLPVSLQSVVDFGAILPQQNDITFCDNNSRCEEKCTCDFQDGQGICIDASKLDEVNSCKCSSNSDCKNGDSCVPFETGFFVCFQCANKASTDAVQNCHSGNGEQGGQKTAQENPPQPTRETNPPKETNTPKRTLPPKPSSEKPNPSASQSTQTDGSSGSSSKKPRPSSKPSPSTAKSSEITLEETSTAESDKNNVSYEENPTSDPSSSAVSGSPPCVSTEWIMNEGLSEFVLRNGSLSRVLCIPGLPCATSGHILRQCNRAKQFSLKTYQEVCEKRLDCTESIMIVSQLSHTFNWSIYKTDYLQLTSLSMHPTAGKVSFSRTIAQAAQFLIQNNMGGLCNLLSDASFYLSSLTKMSSVIKGLFFEKTFQAEF